MTVSTDDDNGPSLASVSRDSLGNDAVARPSMYTHEPVPRLAPLEAYYGASPSAFRSIEVLEELKSHRLEGLYNLSFIFLCFSLAYLSIRNVMEIGFQAGPSSLCPAKLASDAISSLQFLLLLPPWLVGSYALIRIHVAGVLSSNNVIGIHMAGLGAFYVVMSSIILQSSINPIFALFLAMFIVVVSLKQHSWVLTNLILAEETQQRRLERKSRHRGTKLSGDEKVIDETGTSHATSSASAKLTQRKNVTVDDEIQPDVVKMAEAQPADWVPYPKNVTIRNFAQFCMYPTLVYETSYPRTSGVRARYLAWYLSQAGFCAGVDYFLMMQFCVPVWRNSQDIDHMWYFCMKIALPSFIGWLLMFWGFFHCMLNAIAELTRFADRQFYLDWWNATTLDSFWRKWNLCVHEWCLRHLYVEGMNRHNMKPQTAALGTFLFSAIMHEYVCFIGFRLLRPFMFTGMLLQVPLMRFSRRLAGTRQGNVLMWMMLFSGQSIIMLLYARDYLVQNGTLMC